MLRIRASRSGQGSEALVVKDTTAVNGYEAAEDMQLLLDNSLQEIPMVYTLAGNRRCSGPVNLGAAARSGASPWAC